MKAKLQTYIVRNKTLQSGKTSFIVIVRNKTKKKKQGDLPSITLVTEQPVLHAENPGEKTPINTLDDAISILRNIIQQYEADMGCTEVSKISYNTITSKQYATLTRKGALKNMQATNKITSMMSSPILNKE